MIKKIILLLMVLICAFAFMACSETPDNTGDNTQTPGVENGGGTNDNDNNSGGDNSDNSNSGNQTPDSGTNTNPDTENVVTPKEQFLTARESIIGNDVVGFEYDYVLNLEVGLSDGLKLSGSQQGTSQYSKSNMTSYYSEHTNSGLLFNDGVVYEYIDNGAKNTIKVNQDSEIVGFDTQTAQADVKYLTSTFAKAIFEYEDSKITDVIKDGNKYEIKSSEKGSSSLASVLNLVDHPVVERLIRHNLPNVDAQTKYYVTYGVDNNIKTYNYTFEVSVSAISLTLDYTITFDKINQTPAIELPLFTNFYIASNEVSEKLNVINDSIDEFKALSISSNEFKLQTGVDYGISTNAINATIKGESKRKVDNGVYFINKVEVDTDHKNADLYKEAGLEDVTYVRGRLLNGDVFDRNKKILGYDDPQQINYELRNNLDDYYLLLDRGFLNQANINSISFSKKDGKDNYSLTLSKDGTKALLEYVNKISVLNPFIETEIKVMGEYVADDVSLKELKLVVELDENDKLVSIKLKAKGKFDTKFEGSRDFSQSEKATFDIEYSFNAKYDLTEYEIPESAEDLKY